MEQRKYGTGKRINLVIIMKQKKAGQKTGSAAGQQKRGTGKRWDRKTQSSNKTAGIPLVFSFVFLPTFFFVSSWSYFSHSTCPFSFLFWQFPPLFFSCFFLSLPFYLSFNWNSLMTNYWIIYGGEHFWQEAFSRQIISKVSYISWQQNEKCKPCSNVVNSFFGGFHKIEIAMKTEVAKENRQNIIPLRVQEMLTRAFRKKIGEAVWHSIQGESHRGRWCL